MEQIFNIIKQVEQTSSRNEKENIFKQHKNNEELKQILEYTYNPYKIYGIGKKSFKKVLSIKSEFNNIFELLDYLLEYNTGTDETKLKVNRFIQEQSEEYQEWYKRIILKDLRIGATTKTINKIWSGLIPVFDVMLAHKFNDYENKIKGDFIITPKLDGVRMCLIKEGNGITCMSRQGKLIEGLNDILEEAKYLTNNYVYDGELLLKNVKNLPSKDLYRETVKITQKDGIKKDLEFHIFDMIPIDEFKKGESKEGCILRKVNIHNIIENFNWLKEVPVWYMGSDKNEITKWLKYAEDNNYEGIMVNTCEGLYECKRTKELLKVKTFQDVDLMVVGFEEGDGKYVGQLGRLNVEYKGNVVGVGTGLSDHMREEVWINQDKYLGKIAKIKYFEESMNSKTKEVSLRFPVFIEWRFDKNEVSYS